MEEENNKSQEDDGESLGDELDDLRNDAESSANANMAAWPKSKKDLRACLACCLVKNYSQFLADGCDNCTPPLEMADDEVYVRTCTTTEFDGYFVNLNPSKSWVAKWQFFKHYKIGLYALTVRGELPQDKIAQLIAERKPNVGQLLQQLQRGSSQNALS